MSIVLHHSHSFNPQTVTVVLHSEFVWVLCEVGDSKSGKLCFEFWVLSQRFPRVFYGKLAGGKEE